MEKMKYVIPIALLALAIYLHVFRLEEYKGQGCELRKYKEMRR